MKFNEFINKLKLKFLNRYFFIFMYFFPLHLVFGLLTGPKGFNYGNYDLFSSIFLGYITLPIISGFAIFKFLPMALNGTFALIFCILFATAHSCLTLMVAQKITRAKHIYFHIALILLISIPAFFAEDFFQFVSKIESFKAINF